MDSFRLIKCACVCKRDQKKKVFAPVGRERSEPAHAADAFDPRILAAFRTL